MRFFDSLLTLGRTNRAVAEAPQDADQALAVMERYDVAEAMVVHTTGRDADAELGNRVIAKVDHPRLHRVWCIEPACVVEEPAAAFVKRALRERARAFLINPCARNIRIDRCLRLQAIAGILEERRIPLFAVYRQWDAGQDVIDWYDLADFCNRYPNLPVIAWELRTRANRPMFDALGSADNLCVSLAAVWQAQMLEQVCNHFGPRRLLFSLGLPSLDPAMFQAVVTYAHVEPSVRRAVAGETMQTFLKEADYAV